MAEDFSIGVVGLDLFGAALSERLDSQGIGHIVSDMAPMMLQAHVAESGIAPASTPTDVAQMCDLVFITEVSDTNLRDAVMGPTGLVHGLSPGTVLVDMSAAEPGTGVELAGKLASRGSIWIEAAIVGDAQDLRTGTTTLLTSGNAEALQRIAPVLAQIAARTFRLGDLGSGKLAKALGASANAMAMAVYTEVVLIARRAGLDAAGLLAAMPYLAPDAGTPPPAIAEEVLSGRYDTGVPIDLVQRELQLAMRAAASAGAPAPMLSLVQGAFAAARYMPEANGDAADMPRWLAQNAGVEFVAVSDDDSAVTDA